MITYTHNSKEVTASILPDGFFSIGQGEREHPCFLEMDLGTMPVKRSNPHLSSISKKLLLYFHLYDQHRIHKDRSLLSQYFDVSSFRMCFVTSPTERMERMIQVCQELFSHGRKLFWFTTRDQVRLEDPLTLFHPIWYTGQTTLSGGRIIPPQQGLEGIFGAQHTAYLPQALL